MSRWRRQQRKRARRYFVNQRLSAELDATCKAIYELARERIRGHLEQELCSFRLPLPEPGPAVREAIQKAVADAIKHPVEKTTVVAKLKPDGRSLSVDITVRNPSRATAEAILQAGGRWV